MDSPPKERNSGHYNKKHKCTLEEHCWPQGREEINSIFKLYKMRSKKKLALYDQGIDTFEKIKDSLQSSPVWIASMSFIPVVFTAMSDITTSGFFIIFTHFLLGNLSSFDLSNLGIANCLKVLSFNFFKQDNSIFVS